MNRILLSSIALIIFSGCSSVPKVNIDDPNQVARSVKVKVDQFKGTTTFTAPDIGDYNKGIETIMLEVIKKNDKSMSNYMVYLDDNYDAPWRNYNAAYDSYGRKLPVIGVDRRVRFCNSEKCSMAEQFAVIVSRSYLSEYASKGISIKVVGQRGEEVFFLPGSYIEGFLKAVP